MREKSTPPSRQKKSGKAARPAAPARQRCPIVGIGASAGGLEAYTQLLKRLPADTGLGFVLVQHLDPQHPSALAHLLARATTMPVHEVTNNLRVEANHVYVIPPNTNLGIAQGILKLMPRAQSRTALRSIDIFFEALAQDQRQRAIGVILSGTATDGTLGLEAIKAEGGLTFAQDDSARYDSMPRNAAAAGCVDFVLSPENIAKKLSQIAKHPYVAVDQARQPLSPAGTLDADAESAPQGRSEQKAFEKILLQLRQHSGVDFSLYKTPTIHRRITRRTVLNRKQSLADYADSLRGNARELDALYADALINVTSFFRNPETFAVLKQEVLTPLLQQGGDDPVRVWVLGCSTGQEAYSLTMAFAECAEKAPHPRKLQVFATDVNHANLDKARHGLYAKSLVRDVSPERLRRFFVEEEGGYRVIKSLRESVVFARQNLISDPPFSRMDLISCRNLLIYLEPSLQKKLIPTFHYALKPEGILFLGASESTSGFPELFGTVDKKHKLFVKKAAPTLAFHLPIKKTEEERALPSKAVRAASSPAQNLAAPGGALRSELSAEREADRVTVNQFAPPAVLINADLQILQFRGPTGAYLEPPTGKASFDLLKMAREGLMLPLRATINQAKQENKTARKENVPFTQNGRIRAVNVEVVPLKNLKERCFLVLFEDAEKPGRTEAPESPPATTRPSSPSSKKLESSRITGLEQDLAEARDYLHSVEEQQEAANEELQASNEEGQSANEELQSLNEELETSKEELESTNEELTTVNEEMGTRNHELNRLNSDLTNFQTSTKLVIVLLGRDLTVRRFSAQAEKQLRLHPGDLGRPISSVRHNLDLPDLDHLIAEVIASAQECEREVRDRDGRWYSLRVRPYLTLENKVDGAVLVLMDINASKEATQEILHTRDFAEAIINTAHDPLVIMDSDMRVQKANKAFFTTFKTSSGKTTDRSLFELADGQWDIPKLRTLLRDVLPRNSSFNNFEVTYTCRTFGPRTLLLNARTLSQLPGHREKIMLGIQDITARKRVELMLVQTRRLLDGHATQLEGKVLMRTAQLTATNQKLEASLNTVRQSQAENQALLLESQSMQKTLRHLTHQILTTQEEERKKISRELHDEVVQTLVGINVELSALVHGNSPDILQIKDKIVHTQRLVESSVDAVHRFARELRPAVLDDLGLIPALHAFCTNLAERKKIKIKLTAFGGVEAMDSDKRTVLFRVTQEALTNVARHARATQVKVSIRKTRGAVQLEVSDNGKSFPVRKILKSKSKRLGLVGMRERVEMVGGKLTIESAPGKGTTVRAEIPYPPPPK